MGGGRLYIPGYLGLFGGCFFGRIPAAAEQAIEILRSLLGGIYLYGLGLWDK